MVVRNSVKVNSSAKPSRLSSTFNSLSVECRFARTSSLCSSWMPMDPDLSSSTSSKTALNSSSASGDSPSSVATASLAFQCSRISSCFMPAAIRRNSSTRQKPFLCVSGLDSSSRPSAPRLCSSTLLWTSLNLPCSEKLEAMMPASRMARWRPCLDSLFPAPKRLKMSRRCSSSSGVKSILAARKSTWKSLSSLAACAAWKLMGLNASDGCRNVCRLLEDERSPTILLTALI
mmetsp:Transcript_109192/g.319627  ORF Transcript_109192/g.319627 Transcript_109192/m.319627 type:complete len:232 (-) Transcript_109192:41-736(-)